MTLIHIPLQPKQFVRAQHQATAQGLSFNQYLSKVLRERDLQGNLQRHLVK